VWAGGVVVLAAVAWRWHRSEATAGVRATPATVSAAASTLPRAPTLELGVRFSIVATWALLAVAVAGIVMALFILDEPGDVTGTPWGRTLLVKLAVVAVASRAAGTTERGRRRCSSTRPTTPRGRRVSARR